MTTTDLVRPTYWTGPDFHTTLGPEVGELCAAVGYAPDPEQQIALDAIFGLDRHGKHTAFEVGVICNRQNLKTGLVKQAALGKVFLLERKLFVWSAHEFSTAQEAFRDLAQLIESSPMLERRVLRIYRGNGDEAIELRNGSRIKFRARTKAGGRGLSGEDVALDEAFALKPEHMGALLPILSTFPDPQVLYASSAGLKDSEVLRGIRDRGRAGRGRLAYLEWTDEGDCLDPECSHVVGQAVGCRADDREAWVAVNPAMVRGRITEDYVAAERDALPPDEFFRERMGRWDDPLADGDFFEPAGWSPCADVTETGEPASPSPAVRALGVALSVDRRWLSVAAGGRRDDGRVHLGAVLRQQGTAGVARLLREAQDKYRCDVVIDGRGPAADLIPSMLETEPDLTLRVVGLDDVVEASNGLYDAVQAADVAHHHHPELDRAVAAAVWRPVGDRRTIGRRHSTGDVSMLEAAALAWWGVGREVDPVVYVL